MSGQKRAVIFANGEIPDLPAARALLAPDDFLVAADGGSRYLAELGLLPGLLIGDLDSTPPAEAERLARAGVRIERYPPAKNETDLQLALHRVAAEGYRDVLVLGALGGRLDQTLGNLALLTDPALSGCSLRLDDGSQEVFFITSMAEIRGARGDVVSLLPFDGPVEGVVTENLMYPLLAETLLPYQTRGISNVMLTAQASVRISSGRLLCIHARKKDG